MEAGDGSAWRETCAKYWMVRDAVCSRRSRDHLAPLLRFPCWHVCCLCCVGELERMLATDLVSRIPSVEVLVDTLQSDFTTFWVVGIASPRHTHASPLSSGSRSPCILPGVYLSFAFVAVGGFFDFLFTVRLLGPFVSCAFVAARDFSNFPVNFRQARVLCAL